MRESVYVVCRCVCVCASEEVASRENAKEKERKRWDTRDGNDLARKVPRKKER